MNLDINSSFLKSLDESVQRFSNMISIKLGFTNFVRKSFYQKLSKLIVNNVPIVEALNSIRAQRLKIKGKNDPLVILIHRWIQNMREGKTFSESAKNDIPFDEIMLISAGERSGDLPLGLSRAVEMMDLKTSIRKSLVSALLMPTILFIMLFAIVNTIAMFILPQLEKVIRGQVDQLKGMGAFFFKFGHFIQDWGWLIVLVVVGTLVVVLWSLPRWEGKGRQRADKIFPWSFYRLVTGIAFLNSLSALISTDMKIVDALRLLSRQSSPYVKSRIEAALRQMRHGVNFGEALAMTNLNYPDIEIIDDLTLYSRFDAFDKSLALIASQWREQIVERIKAIGASLNFVALLMIGMILILLMGGMFDAGIQIRGIMMKGMH